MGRDLRVYVAYGFDNLNSQGDETPPSVKPNKSASYLSSLLIFYAKTHISKFDLAKHNSIIACMIK